MKIQPSLGVDRLGVVLVEVQTPSDGSPFCSDYVVEDLVPHSCSPVRAGTFLSDLIGTDSHQGASQNPASSQCKNEEWC